MKLASVRALKQQLLIVPRKLVENVAASTSFGPFAASSETAARVMNRIALGVTPKRGTSDFRLAVRPQRSGPLISAMVAQIEREAKGEVDVQFVGNLVKFAKLGLRAREASFYQVRSRPLRIGVSISDIQSASRSAGTLGCFVVGRRSPHFLGILTNNHVIANENENSIGAPIVQPGTLDGRGRDSDRIGELGRFVKLKPNEVNFIDAAVGDLYEGVEYEAGELGNLGMIAGIGEAADLPAGSNLYKVGRTTGQTKGRITAFDVDNVWVEYDMGLLRFDNQIEIEGAFNNPFSDGGDSGALIVDADRRAVALLFAGGDVGGSNGQGLTYANPIGPVLEELQVDLEL